MKRISTVAALFVAATASGCASTGSKTETVVASEPALVADQLQSVTVSTVGESQAPVEAVRCSLRNDKGTWEVRAPGSVSVARSTRPLEIVCLKPGYRTLVHAAEAQGGLLISAAKGAAVGGTVSALAATPLLAIPVFGPFIYAGAVGGSALLGGTVNAVIDHNKGTPYRYPDRIVLPLVADAGRKP